MATSEQALSQEPIPEKPGSEHSKQALRLWLRLLTCSTEIEKLIRGNLTRDFGTTLPRFDILSALDRNPDGLTMSALSKLLKVSNGNVTGLVDRLVQENLVEREAMERDRRIYKVTITNSGKLAFREMAVRHEGWLDDMFERLANDDIEDLLALLTKLRHSVAQRKKNRG
ncbi:MAG: MarR family transcriptional regulator [Novosphingobium sp.]